MQNGPALKVLVALDLDYTHFNSSVKSTAHWLGDEREWVDFYQSQVEYASRQGVELYFMVITNKSHFDDHAEVAAKAFAPLLCLGNPHMYLHEGNEQWCLVDVGEEMVYECLQRNAKKQCRSKDIYSHFFVLPFSDKTPHILSLAKRHGIPASQCLLLDDTQEHLESAKSKGIETVSFAEFSPDDAGSEDILYDEKKIATIVAAKRESIAHKIKRMVLRGCPERVEMTDDSVRFVSEQVVESKDGIVTKYYDTLKDGVISSFSKLEVSGKTPSPFRTRHN